MATSRKKTAPVIKKKELRMTSIRLDNALVERLQKRATSLGIGWQTLLKMVLSRYAEAEL